MLEQEADEFEALERAAIRHLERWSTEKELAAMTVEMLHSLYLLMARANGAKNVGKPMHIPRPGEKTGQLVMSPAAFARELRSA
ncbi:MAG: hypothetical protein ACO28P_01365 [Ilumatobacteraceae bacterium]